MLVDFTAMTPKFSALADSVTAELPVPLRLTFCGLFEALRRFGHGVRDGCEFGGQLVIREMGATLSKRAPNPMQR